MIHRPSRLDDATGVERGRDRRWPNAVPGPTGDRAEVTTPGRDETPPARPRYLGTSGEPRVDEVPHPIGAGPPHPLRGWRLGWSCRGRTLAHHPMAHARDRPQEDVPQLTCQWRPGLVSSPPPPVRDQVAGEAGARIAGHPGQPPAVVNTGGAAGADGSRAHVAAARAHPRPRRSSGCASAEGTSSGGWWHTAHTSRASRGATPRAHRVRVSRRLPTRAPAVAPRGVTRPSAAVIAVVQRRARRRARACLKGPCRRGTACGLCGDRGVAHTGIVRQTTGRGLWHALRVFIRGDDVATRSWEPGVSCGSWSSPKRILSLLEMYQP